MIFRTCLFNLLSTENPLKGNFKLANIEDSEEMPHYAAFHEGLHCLLTETKSIVIERNIIFLEIITCDPSKYTMDHSEFIVRM